MRFRPSAVGTLVGPDVEVSGARIDSRAVRGGELFVPVKAARDGHDFIAHALAAGAAAYLTEHEPLDEVGTAVIVPDTAEALAELARRTRARLPDRVVGITGSTGKTSTKDLLAPILEAAGPCGVSERSQNNELGVPLTILNAPDGADALVVEMGARGAGHIRWLCEVARPTVGVVTNVTHSHTAYLGSLDGVAAAKAELVQALPSSGVAVLNAGDERVAAMAAATEARVVTFGVDAGDVRATGVTVDGDLRPSFVLETPWGSTPVRLDMRGAHQAANAAAAAAAALALGVDLAGVGEGLERAASSPWRMDVGRTPAGAVVVNDAYNANPASTEAALRALASVDITGRHVAVLGSMLELGDASAAQHRRVAALADALGIELVAVATDEYGVAPVADPEAALAAVAPLGPDDAVLVKASRAAGLERLAARLLAGEADATATGAAPGEAWPRVSGTVADPAGSEPWGRPASAAPRPERPRAEKRW